MVWLAEHPAHEVLWFQEGTPPVDMLRKWGVTGILGHFRPSAPVDPLLQLQVPIVNLSSQPQPAPVITVCCDHEGLGRQAATYLFDRGVRNFAYLGLEGLSFSQQRQAGFQKKFPTQCAVLNLPKDMSHWLDLLKDWVLSLPQPCGVFCVGDNEARILLTLCRTYGIRVPEDLLVLGCNNERDVCASCHPTLSSVRAQARKIARTGLKWLTAMIQNGLKPNPRKIVIPSGPVEERGSTDLIFAVTDPQISAVLQFIQKHHHEIMGVEDLLTVYPGSRRSLEQRFRKALGRTPLEEIHRIKINLIKKALRDTEDTLSEIANKCGLSGPGALGNFFRKHQGLSPQAFRKKLSRSLPRQK